MKNDELIQISVINLFISYYILFDSNLVIYLNINQLLVN